MTIPDEDDDQVPSVSEIESPFTVDPISSSQLVVRRYGETVLTIPVMIDSTSEQVIESMAEAMERLLSYVWVSGKAFGARVVYEAAKDVFGGPEA